MSLRYAVLGMLEERPLHGYELKQRIEGAFGDAWSVSFGQLYPTLHRMAELKLIGRTVEPGKKALDKTVYRITEKGTLLFNEWFSDVPKAGNYRVRDEFTILFYFLRKHRPYRIVEVLEKQREFLEKQIMAYDERLRVVPASDQDYFSRSIQVKGSLHLHAELDWLLSVISDMKGRERI